ncbi:MFS transporter [Saccharopolyspora sp. 5N102]|uniref:MFS transporter n=1 Tax=Saccharopolyspora sp. 5N102 TaxID=3375155 RepID=UPI0037B74339
MAVPQTTELAGSGTRRTQPGSVRAWLVVAMVVTLMVINFGDKAVLGLAAGPIMRELGLSAAEYGAVASSFYLLFSLSAVLVGFLSNRVKTTWILGILAVLWSLTSVPLLLAASVSTLYLSRIALGAAEGPTAPMVVHAVQKWFPEDRRSVPTALTQMGGALGLVIASPTLVYLITNHGWRAAFVALALAGVVWVVLWAFIGREGPLTTYDAGQHGVVQAGGEPEVPYRKLFFNGTFVGGLLAGVGAYWALAMNTAWLPMYLEKALGYEPHQIGVVVVIPNVLNALVMLVVPWLSGRWMRRGATGRVARGVVAGLAVTFAGGCMLLLPHTSGVAALVLMTLAFGLPSVAFPLGYLTAAQIAPVRKRGAVIASKTALVTLAGVFAPAVTGALVQAAGSGGTGFQTAFGLCAGLMIVGGLLAVLVVNPERDARRLGLLPAAADRS